MKAQSFAAALSLAAILLPPGIARAGEGHDHGDAAMVGTGPAQPRFAAVSEAFELVGVLEGKLITLYLDRAPDNSPVTEAQIELEVGGTKLKARPSEEGHGGSEFEVVLDAEPEPGVLPVTATVTVGDEVDLLAGELDIHEEAHAEEVAHTPSWKQYAVWAAVAIAALAVLTVVVRRVATLRGPRAGGAA